MAKTTPKQKVQKAKIVPKDEEQRLYRYWMNQISRAAKAQPSNVWEKTRNRYRAKTDDSTTEDTRPYVNDCRKMQESCLAFLDQQEPSFKISPAEAFIGDEIAQKQAQCEGAYLKRIWKEQKCQKVQSRKLNSALLVNNGCALTQFDVKKWMPSLRYLRPEQVLFDRDCNGLLEEAGWIGFWEDVATEEFRSWHQDMAETKFKAILDRAGSVLTEEEKESVASEEDKKLYKTIRVYHIFARNASAVRKEKDDGIAKVPDKKLAEELQLETPRRYMQFVKGHPAPITDDDNWPFDLDHDEFPISHLQFNQTNGDIYGFTDYEQMSRLDELSDDIMGYVGKASFWAAVQKFACSSNQQVSDTELADFFNNPNTSFLQNMLDSEGNLKAKPLERGRIDIAQIEAYKLAHDQAKEASALSELLENAEAQAYKDVTALAARIVDANMHQRVNRRLGGPWGYEDSIAEDAIKLLEVAHQFIPQVSQVTVMKDFPVLDELTQQPIIDEATQQPAMEQKEDLVELPWAEALQAMADGGTLIKLGIDAIVGQELAQFWPYKQPPEQWRLSTKVIVEPGTTRSITKEQQTAIMKQLYVELYQPFYEAIGRPDLAREFLEMIGRLATIPNIDNLLPELDEVKEQMQRMEQQKQMEQQMAMQQQQQQMQQQVGEQGGQPLNSPEATGGERQTAEGEQIPVI